MTSLFLLFYVFSNCQDSTGPIQLSTNQIIQASTTVEEKLQRFELELKRLQTLLDERAKEQDPQKIEAKEQEITKKRLILREEAIVTAENTQKVMELTADLINNTLATANLFSNVANAMRVLDSTEAEMIDKKSINLEKFYNKSSSFLMLGGAILSSFYIIDDNSDSKPPIISLSISSIGSLIFRQLSDNKKIKNSAKYVHNKATQLSIHAFLLIRIRSVSSYMIELENRNKQIIATLKGKKATIGFEKTDDSEGSLPTPEIQGLNARDNWSDIKTLISIADEILRLIEQVDFLYNVELSTLQKEITIRSSYNIYTEDGRKSLENLAASAENARESWKNVRYFYTQVESALTRFRSGSDILVENSKPAIKS